MSLRPNRADGSNRKVYDQVLTGADGMLTVGLDRTFTSAPITRCTIYPREMTRRLFIAPKFTASDAGSFGLVKVSRSNTDVQGVFFRDEVALSEYYTRQLIWTSDCCFVKIHNCAAEGQREGSSAYTIAGSRNIFVEYEDIYAVDGWGTVGTNELKYNTWRNCQLSRIDVHWGARRYNSAQNCVIKQGATTIGGSGIFEMVDCEYVVGGAASSADNYSGAMLSPRLDYGWEFYGTFRVIRPRITIGSEITGDYGISIVRAGGELTYDPGRDVRLPNVVVRDPIVTGAFNHATSDIGVVIYACDLQNSRATVGGRKMTYPSLIEFSGGAIHGFSPQARVTFCAVRANQYAHESVIGWTNRLTGGTNCDIVVRDVKSWNPDGVSPDGGTSRGITEFKMAQSNWGSYIKMVMLRHGFRL